MEGRESAAPLSAMRALPSEFDPARMESEAREFWRRHGLPPEGIPPEGAPTGAVTLWSGTVATERAPSTETLARLVVADTASRYLRQSGRPAQELLPLRGSPDGRPPEELRAELDHLAIWYGLGRPVVAVPTEGRERRSQMLGALASEGAIVVRHVPQRTCPGCGEPRALERAIYQAEFRRIYLVRFPIGGTDPPVSALVWTDAVWKLLGAEALVLHPDRPYVRVRWTRHGSSEELLLAASATDRLSTWWPGGRVEVLETRPGAQWAGQPYLHPLQMEVPALAQRPAPGGVLRCNPGVHDRGSGVVPLVPAHGPADAEFAQRDGYELRSVVDGTGTLSTEPRHKYSGLPLDTAEACILRDLVDDGTIFAELREPAGVPHCQVCGAELFWRPDTVWSVDLAAVPEEVRAWFERLRVGERFPQPSFFLPWPISTGGISPDPADPELAECTRCGRLWPPPGPAACSCGGPAPQPTRRRLLTSFEEPLAYWAEIGALPIGGGVWLFVPERRRTAIVLPHLLALHAGGATPADLRAVRSRALPPEGSAEELAEPPPSDALRAAMLRLAAGVPAQQSLAEAIVEETHRLTRVWRATSQLLRAMTEDLFPGDELPVSAYLADLLPEDRGLLAVFERTRLDVLRRFDAGEWAEGYARLARFLDRTMGQQYLPLVAGRLHAPRGAPEKLALFHVLSHVVPRTAELAAPVLPHLAETVHRCVRGDASSVFEVRIAPLVESLLDPEAERMLERWSELVRAVRSMRRELRLSPTVPLPQLVLILGRDEDAGSFAPHAGALARLLRTTAVNVHSPAHPWAGQRIEARPDADALRRAYPNAFRRIMTLLVQLDGRRIRAALRNQTLAVALEGQPPIKIPPSMVEIRETLPDRFVALPWRYGELYAELPGAAGLSAPGSALPREVDRVRYLIARRLRRAGVTAERPAKAFLWAEEPAGALLGQFAPELGRGLALSEVRVVDSPRLFKSAETTESRTRSGLEVRLWIPGDLVTRRPASIRPPRTDRSRLRRPPPRTEPEGVDFLDEGLRTEEDARHALLAELDGDGGLPFLGPAKLRAAHAAGFTNRGEFERAGLEQLASVEGFGPVLSHELVHRLAPDRPLPELPALLSRPAPVAPAPSLAAPAAEVESPVPVDPEPVTAPAPSASPPPVLAAAPPTVSAPPPATVDLRIQLPPAPRPAESALYTVVPAAAVAGPAPAHGGLRLPLGPTRDEAWDAFTEHLGRGAVGLWVGRLFPRALQLPGRSFDVRFLWLSTSDRPNSVRPGDLESLGAQVARAVLDGGVQVVMIEEIEYLVALNGPRAVRTMLGQFAQLARDSGAMIWVPVLTGLLGPVLPEEIDPERVPNSE